MAEIVETIQVRLKYSKAGATAQINANDFDPEKHARMDEPEPKAPEPAPPPSTPPPSTPGTPTGGGSTEGTSGESETGSTGRRRP
jgi:hypothetical protein